jgi:hypothetical protein
MPRRFLVCLLLFAVPSGAAGQRPVGIPTPRSVLGFDPGDDRKLADWPTLVSYYQALARASERIDYREIGKTTLGAPFVVLAISAPLNLRRLDLFRRSNARLADPRTLRSTREATTAMLDGRTMVFITSGIHSDEVGGSLTPARLAYRLATDTSAATRAILDNVILWLVPSLNPDGVTIVAKWYAKTLGTAAEGSDPPELYHSYTGHDNNRDWYAFTQIETRLVVDSLYNVWHPQIVLDLHQQGSAGSRLFLPPYLDPIEPNVDPLLVNGTNTLGTAIAWELAAEGKTGISVNAIYDAWTPARAYPHYHGAVRILPEAASADPRARCRSRSTGCRQGARGFNPRERSWNFTTPWPGGRWTLRDIVGYRPMPRTPCSRTRPRHRARWLDSFLSVGWRAVRGWRDGPTRMSFHASRTRWGSPACSARWLAVVEIRSAQQAFTVRGQRYPAGVTSWCCGSPTRPSPRPCSSGSGIPIVANTWADRRNGPTMSPPHVALLLGVTAVEVSDSAARRSGAVAPPRATPGYADSVEAKRLASDCIALRGADRRRLDALGVRHLEGAVHLARRFHGACRKVERPLRRHRPAGPVSSGTARGAAVAVSRSVCRWLGIGRQRSSA